jgi:hypothetical protein
VAAATKAVGGELAHGALSDLADLPICGHVASAVVGGSFRRAAAAMAPGSRRLALCIVGVVRSGSAEGPPTAGSTPSPG